MITRWIAELAIVALLSGGCATPVGVKRVDEEAAYRAIGANVLSTGTLSSYTSQVLERNALVVRYRKNPGRAIAELYSGLGKPDEPDRLFALTELSFAHAAHSDDRSYYLASAVFAFAYLFPEDAKYAPSAYDPRLRLAVDLYNRALAAGLATPDRKEVDLSTRQLPLPFGTLSLAAPQQGFQYGGCHLTKFVSLSDLEVRGLRNRYRNGGIGAPLSASVEPVQDSTANRWIPPRAKVPVTAFVRFENPRRGMSTKKFRREYKYTTLTRIR